MSEEIEKTSGDQIEGKESKALDQDEISKLIEEMQGEDNLSENTEQVEITTDDEKKQKSDDKKDDESENEESNTLDQDDISKIIDEVQSEEESSEAEETEDTTKKVEKDDAVEKNVESEIPEDENTQTVISDDDNVKENGIEEKGESQEQDENLIRKDKNTEKEIDEKDTGSFKGLDSDDEVEIGGDPDAETDKSDHEDNDNKSNKYDEDKDKRSEKNDDEGQAGILKEVNKRSKGKRFKLLISCILSGIFISVLLGVYIFYKESGTDIIKAEKPLQPEQIAKPENNYSKEKPKQQIKVYATKEILLNDNIIAKMEEITKLRNKLLIKEKEITDLIRKYKNGISEMEDEILKVKQNIKINSFSGAIKNKKIEFGMMTIQRRLAYIEKIDPPYKWLNQGIEELLYLKHKIEIDAQVSGVISGIDMDKMIQEIDIVIQSYRTGIENLEIDMKSVELMSLEMIWNRIIDKEKYAAGNNEKVDETKEVNESALTNEDKNNRMIWEEICSGNFKRKSEMTKLSTEAAKCLAKWKNADLFLNEISELSPEVTRCLLKWKGNWICLNGVKKLSSEAAKHLFQWQGNWISLNGLSEISPGLQRYLPQWQGKQLELMGLEYKKSKGEVAGLKSLVKWEKLGGKLFIPVQVREIINKL